MEDKYDKTFHLHITGSNEVYVIHKYTLHLRSGISLNVWWHWQNGRKAKKDALWVLFLQSFWYVTYVCWKAIFLRTQWELSTIHISFGVFYVYVLYKTMYFQPADAFQHISSLTQQIIVFIKDNFFIFQQLKAVLP